MIRNKESDTVANLVGSFVQEILLASVPESSRPSVPLEILNGIMGPLIHNSCSKCSDEIVVSVDVESGEDE